MKHAILETERLYLRQLTQADFGALCRILQDEQTMYAYDGAFSDEEVHAWLDRQIGRYEKYGFGPCAVVLKESGEMIGQCGLSWQLWVDREVLELGYQFRRDHWHRGYATEAARAWKEYAFSVLQAEEVCSIIRDFNTPSQRVALRNGMVKKDRWTKPYRGIDMVSDRYVVARETKEKDTMELTVKHFRDLTARELWEIYRLRVSVFVVEQECPYQEVDDHDPLAWHVCMRDEGGLQAYARVLPAGTAQEEVSIGRVISQRRRTGLGTKIVQEAIRVAEQQLGAERIVLEAQVYAKNLYAKLGFREVSEEFLEDGIPHVRMLRSREG